MKKILTTAVVALLTIVLGQNITHASTDSITWTWDNAAQRTSKDEGVGDHFIESPHFNESNEWVYVDITNTSKTEKAPLQYFGADVKDGNDDGFDYTVDKETKIITGIENYHTGWKEHPNGKYYAQLSGHEYLAPGETAHFKLKVAATSGYSSISATKVRGVYYAFSEGVFYDPDTIASCPGDGTYWFPINFKLNVHFWTNNEGWTGTFDVRH